MSTIEKEIKYLRLAEHFARSFSKDRSTQVGAFFLHPTEFTILSAGYNGIPRGCDDDEPRRHERPLKYEYAEHAERNAIYNAVRDRFRGCSIVCTAPLEIDDIRAIISVGAASLAACELPIGETARLLMQEAGVAWLQPDPSVPPGVARFVRGDKVLAEAHVDEAGPVPEESTVRRAIFAAARPLLEGSTAVVGPLPPCIQCARALTAVGSRRVVTNRPSADHETRWGSSIRQTRGLFTTVGIDMVES